MINDLSDEFIFNYNRHINKIVPIFRRIADNESEENVFMTVSVAFRIAAKLCRIYGYSREEFLSAAIGNYDLENKKQSNNLDNKVN